MPVYPKNNRLAYQYLTNVHSQSGVRNDYLLEEAQHCEIGSICPSSRAWQMTVAQQAPVAVAPRRHAWVLWAVLASPWDSARVRSFAPSTSRGRSCRRRARAATSEVRRRAHHRAVEVRPWLRTGDEPRRIYRFLQRERDGRQAAAPCFDPEGALDLDVAGARTLAEAYAEDDGGCFWVAVTSHDQDADQRALVGTLGIISGTEVSYRSSGSSFAKSDITAAMRRVCASPVGNGQEDVDAAATKILESLIRQGERQARRAGATTLVGLAYPEVATSRDGSSGNDGRRRDIVKPTAKLLASLGYQPSEQQLSRVVTTQFEKKLPQMPTNELDNNPEGTTFAQGREWIFPASFAALLSLGLLVFHLYRNVFGIEQLWGSADNGGIGTSLSTQNLEELVRDERLGRTGLDGGTSSAAVREWQDLSDEELREEQALMRVIQGQDIRAK